MGTTAANVSQLLRRLEADGYVARARRGRERLVQLTDEGAAVLGALAADHRAFMAGELGVPHPARLIERRRVAGQLRLAEVRVAWGRGGYPRAARKARTAGSSASSAAVA